MLNIFYGKAKNGEIEWDNKNTVFKYLTSLEGKAIHCQIEQMKSKRTLDQNALYWMYLTIISRETGELESNLHEVFKRLCLPPQFITYKGRQIKIPGSTTKLSKSAMGEYLDRICAETNVPIPDTEEYKGLKQVDYPQRTEEPLF